MTRVARIALLGLAGLLVAPAAAQDARAAAESDFVNLCTVVLLAPNDIPKLLSDKTLSEVGTMKVRPTMDVTVYGTGGDRNVNMTRQRFSDFTTASCVVSLPGGSSVAQIADMRTRLESNPLIGKLEGEIIETSPTMRIATFKRPGNVPIVTINIAALNITTLTINRWDTLGK